MLADAYKNGEWPFHKQRRAPTFRDEGPVGSLAADSVSSLSGRKRRRVTKVRSYDAPGLGVGYPVEWKRTTLHSDILAMTFPKYTSTASTYWNQYFRVAQAVGWQYRTGLSVRLRAVHLMIEYENCNLADNYGSGVYKDGIDVNLIVAATVPTNIHYPWHEPDLSKYTLLAREYRPLILTPVTYGGSPYTLAVPQVLNWELPLDIIVKFGAETPESILGPYVMACGYSMNGSVAIRYSLTWYFEDIAG